jgi:predicted ATPase/DNA-binding SARP family transcriptional activator
VSTSYGDRDDGSGGARPADRMVPGMGTPDTQVRVLGPVEVQAPGGSPLSPAPSVRAVLARLAMSPGRVVSADALTDALWGEDLPADAANALQVRVSKLRRALATAGFGGGLIVTRAPGYLLALPADAVDAHRFETAAADPSLTGLEEALRLWRGPALADVGDTEWSRAERTRLDELRLGAEENRLELLIDAGRHAEALADLDRLAGEHPLRERLHRLLMLALYRSGRQADALAAEQRLRRRLADELGIDPSPELRELTSAILRQEIRPAVRETGAVPERLTSFVGRDDDVRTTLEQLRSARLVTLTGPGGVGKTSLAMEVARVSQPVHIVRLAAVDADADLGEVFATQLGLQSPGPQAVGAVAEHLRGRGALLVVDNCEHVIDAAATVVDSLLRATADLRVLATSREALAVGGETQIAVGPLAEADAERLFLDRARSVRPGLDPDAEDAEAVASICRSLDGIPLAIELAAARAKALPPAEIADRLRDRFALLTAGPRTSEARHRTLRATIDWSFDLLAEPEQRLLRRLAVFRGGWTLDAAERVCGSGVADPLFRLVDRSLVVADPVAGRFRLLVTIREYALERLRESGELTDIRRRHLACYTALAEEHGPLARFAGTAYASLTADHDNFRAAMEFCLELPSAEAGLRLAAALMHFWNFGPRHEGVRAISALLSRPGVPDAARALALQEYALLHVYYPTAESQAAGRESLAMFEALGDDRQAAVSRLVVAFEGQYGGDPHQHRALIRRSRDGLAGVDRGWWHAMTYYVEGLIDLRAGDFETSARHWRRALELLDASGDVQMGSAAKAHLGIALREAGRPEEGVTVLVEAVRECRAAGSLHGLSFSLVQLAHTRLDLGHVDGVPADLDEVDEVARRVRNPRNPAWAAWGRARLALARGDTASAADDCRRAMALLADREFPWARERLEALGTEALGTEARPVASR